MMARVKWQTEAILKAWTETALGRACYDVGMEL